MSTPPVIVEIDKDPKTDDYWKALLELTKQETVPNIFIHGKHVGGCDDVHALHSQGKLVPMLEGK